MFCRRRNEPSSIQREENLAGSPTESGSASASTRKFRLWFTLVLLRYTRAVLLKTSRPISARHSQLKSRLDQRPLLLRPSEKSGLAFPITLSSLPVGSRVSPATQSGSARLQRKN